MQNDQVTIGADAIRLICDQAVRASKADASPVPGTGKALIRSTNGTVSYVDTPPLGRSHEFANIDSFVRFVEGAREGQFDAKDPIVFYGPEGAMVLLDSESRIHRGSLPLEMTAAFEGLCDDGAFTQRKDQAGFLRMLRVDLFACLPGGSIINDLKAVKFTSARQRTGDIARGKESMTKAGDDEMVGAERIPEMIELLVQVFDCPELNKRYRIVCALEIFPGEALFQLVPLPMECSNVLAEAIEDFGEALNVPCPKFAGKP